MNEPLTPSPNSPPPAAQALGERERELVALLAHSPDGLLVLDSSGRILATNAAGCRLTGCSGEDLLAMSVQQLHGPGEGPVFARLRDQLTSGGAAQCHCHLRHKGGSLRAVEVSASREPGVSPLIFCFLHDLTERNRQQSALSLSQAELEAANDQLESAARQAAELAYGAEAANRAKSAFLASMGHELRTPLNVINGLAATLAETAKAPDDVHAATLILDSGQNLLGIIEELIDFSGLQAGKVALEPRTFDLLGLVTQALRSVGHKVRAKSMPLTYRVRRNVPARVVGDPRRLQQVLLNLLDNAVTYTQTGGVHLDVAARRHDGCWRIAFTVVDTGMGIPACDLPKLFQSFARAEFGTTRSHHGTGLGLAIAQAFAQLMGGSIAVRSRVGKGSIFRCSVELGEADGGTALVEVAPPAASGRRALLVCSDPRTREFLANTLCAWGLQPTVWGGPGQNIAPDNDEPFDVAIVEASLARSLGAMLGRHLQSRTKEKSVSVVWLTSPSHHWPVPPAARAASVPLPTDLTELARTVAGLLTPASAPGEAAPVLKLGERLPLRLLVADDIPTNREMLKRLFQHLGYKAQLVTNGAEAVEALLLQPFDLVVLDVEMPVMNGLAAAREIVRRHPDAANRPKLVALTANTMSGDREKCLAAGMDEYLSKPVLPTHIETCFLRLFRRVTTAGPAQPAGPASEPELVDRNQLAALFPGLPGGQVAEVLRQLQASAGRDLATAWPRLGEACANRNMERLAETAHGLKGCFTMLGWARLAAFCAAAITQARAGQFEDWATFGPDLQRLHDLSAVEMSCYLEELETGVPPVAIAPQS
jgi:PAS domain S-box-containing protein